MRSFLLLVVPFLLPISSRAACLEDYHRNQSWQPHGLSREQLSTAEDFARSGNPEQGWLYLASLGDAYAGLAANVVAPHPGSIADLFHSFVRRHWVNAAGEPATRAYFSRFARQHFRQYVEVLATGTWPDADQILNSYLHSARSHGLPETVVFDAVWTASDAANLVSWQILNELPAGRQIFPSRICLHIPRSLANRLLERDFTGR